MKQLSIALVLFLTLSANTCKNSTGEMPSLKDKKWVFASVAGEAINLPEGAERPWLQLAGDQLQGFGGCNRLMGGYTLEGAALRFSDVGSTKKYCEGIQPTETAIMSMLGKVDGYKMDGGTLKLLSGKSELAALQAE